MLLTSCWAWWDLSVFICMILKDLDTLERKTLKKMMQTMMHMLKMMHIQSHPILMSTCFYWQVLPFNSMPIRWMISLNHRRTLAIHAVVHSFLLCETTRVLKFKCLPSWSPTWSPSLNPLQLHSRLICTWGMPCPDRTRILICSMLNVRNVYA